MTIVQTVPPQARANAFALLDLGRRNGGHTIHRPGRSEHHRYIVGGLVPSIRVPVHTATHPATVHFITTRLVELVKDYPRAETLGSWLDGTTLHIDLGTTTDSRDTALFLARQRGEVAVYDTLKGESIQVSGARR